MHAIEGARRGYEVVHLERDSSPRGASVRSIGFIWVSGHAPGAELEFALSAREQWESIAAAAPGTGFRAHGSLTVAQHPAELAPLEAAASSGDATERGLLLLGAAEARVKNPHLRGSFIGALYSERDAIVEPRSVLGALRAYLDRTGSYRYLPGRSVIAVEPHAVRDQTGERHGADLVICCIGAHPGPLFEDLLHGAPVRRVRLQMLETEPLSGELTTAVADAASLRYSPAFDLPQRQSLEPEDRLVSEWRAQLLLVQRLGGYLTIGETYRVEEPLDFDLHDAADASPPRPRDRPPR